MWLGLDIGDTKCAVLAGELTSSGMVVCEKKVIATAEAPDPRQMLPLLIRAGKEICPNPKAVGVSCGGPLDAERGVILSPPNLPGWDEIPICRMLREAFDCPAVLCNDADACALAEWKFGAGAGCRNLVFLTFGTGLGAGLILNGALYPGSCGMAGEIGHVRLRKTGPIGYGKPGSAEGFCSGGGIAQQLHAAGIRDRFPTAAAAAAAAPAGEPVAQAVFYKCGEHLGEIRSLLIDLLNPEKIVIGSIFARCEDLLREPMQQIIDREALSRSARACSVVPAALGETLGDVAALAVAADPAARQNFSMSRRKEK